MKHELVRMEHISKSFNDVKMLNNVNFDVLRGEIVALMGQNGSAKTTLMYILSGICRKDSGTIYFNGEKIDIVSSYDAQKLGIFYIQRTLHLVPTMTIADNIFLGKELDRSSFLYRKKASLIAARRLLDAVKLDISPHLLVKDITPVQQQMVRLAKALAYNAKLMIIDEVMDLLAEKEAFILKETIMHLRNQGVSVIFISHKINEVFSLADRVAVLRKGNIAGMFEKAACTPERIINLIAGHENNLKLETYTNFRGNYPVAEAIRLENISAKSLRNINFSMKKGEILGMLYINQVEVKELVGILFGLLTKYSGEFYIGNKPVRLHGPWEALKHGISLVPEDVRRYSVFFNLTFREHIALSILPRIKRGIGYNIYLEKFISQNMIKDLNMDMNIEQPVKSLSMGQKQKVAIARSLAANPDILVIQDSLTNLDQQSKRDVQLALSKLAENRKSVLLLSCNSSELVPICDRILVMFEGTIKEELPKEEFYGIHPFSTFFC